MSIESMNPCDAFNDARDLVEFLEAAVAAFSVAGDGSWPNERGWSGLLTITVLLRDLMNRAGESM